MSSSFQPSFKPDEYLIKPGIGRVALLARKLSFRSKMSSAPAARTGADISQERIDEFLRQGNFFYSSQSGL